MPSLPLPSALASTLGWENTQEGQTTQVRNDALHRGGARTAGSGERRVVIYFSDTGGGHRTAAASLEAALLQLYGGQVSVKVTDFIRSATPRPWSLAPETYQVAGQFPSFWKTCYEYDEGSRSWRETNTWKMIWWSSQAKIKDFLLAEVDDGVCLIISVHPLINHLIIEALEDLGMRRRVQVATIITDLGSAHLSWFEPRVDVLFVPSKTIFDLAIGYGFDREKIVHCGLPVRQGFWEAGTETKSSFRQLLGIDPEEMVVLVMGGGEGFGAVYDIAVAIGSQMAEAGLGQLVVICGRNEELFKKLEDYEWPVPEGSSKVFDPLLQRFVNNMHEFMGAADCLVTKAGPGTIAEAMIKGLPCLLTSFVPGQEEGNVSFVTEAGAGKFVQETDPNKIADTVLDWLCDKEMMEQMSKAARKLAKPRATLEIARRLGDDLLNLGTELQSMTTASHQEAEDGGCDPQQQDVTSDAGAFLGG